MIVNNFSQNKHWPARDITKEETKELLELKPEDLTTKKLQYLFGANLSRTNFNELSKVNPEDKNYDEIIEKVNAETKPKFQTDDRMIIPVGLFYNTSEIHTTVGRYIYNMYAVPKKDPMNYMKIFGYTNVALNKKALEKIEKNFATYILDLVGNEKIEALKQYTEWMDRTEYLSDAICVYIAPSLDNYTTLPMPEIMKKRDELFEKYKDKIVEGDSTVINNIEDELTDMAFEKLEKDADPAFDIFKSGTYKPMVYKKQSIMGGAAIDPVTGKINVIKNNYIHGMTPEEFTLASSQTVAGGYSRGIKTADYGYLTKKLTNALHDSVVDYSIEDCGTKLTLDIVIPENIKVMFYYRYIVENGKLIEITPKNIDKYVGKLVHLRSPMFCKSDHICAHCAGTLFKKVDINNIGILASVASGNLLNSALAVFHDSTVHLKRINFDDYIKAA